MEGVRKIEKEEKEEEGREGGRNEAKVGECDTLRAQPCSLFAASGCLPLWASISS